MCRVFITNLKFVDNFLLVKDEDPRCYSINLKSKHVEKQPCDSSFSS
jgi:hypothetical protein